MEEEIVYRLETVDKYGGTTRINTKNIHRIIELLTEMLDSDTNPFLSFNVYILGKAEDADASYMRTIMAGWKDVNNL